MQNRYDLRILQALRRIIRATEIYSRKLQYNYNITSPQLICLLAITGSGHTNATKIAKNVHLSTSTVVGILDRLERNGLVARMRDARDRRVVDVSATEAGLTLARNVPLPLQKSLTEALGTLPEAKQAGIAESLEQLIDMMELSEIGAAPILETGSIDEDVQKNLTEQETEPEADT
jgi:DNA-binding MarR family transcriptional regulator